MLTQPERGKAGSPAGQPRWGANPTFPTAHCSVECFLLELLGGLAVNRNMKQFDPTTLEIYRALYTSVAEEMGIALRRTAFSPNIKERRDYSCAVFDSSGRVIAQGDHVPVHLGSMPMAVAAALKGGEMRPGDVIALNDPFAGGTHLPDVTLVMGVFGQGPGAGGRGSGKTKT